MMTEIFEIVTPLLFSIQHSCRSRSFYILKMENFQKIYFIQVSYPNGIGSELSPIGG